MIGTNTIQAMDMIRAFYGARTTKRHAIPLMDHIDQGVAILRALGADDHTIAAFVLHPIFQSDANLAENFDLFATLDRRVVALVMEYRNAANQGLRGRTPASQVPLPISEVRQMLIADKVQNRYSMMKYHRHTHPDAEELLDYFNQWLSALDVSSGLYESLIATFDEKHGEPECPTTPNARSTHR